FAAPNSIAGTRFITVESLRQTAYSDTRMLNYWARCIEIAAIPEHIDAESSEVMPPVLELDDAAIQVWIDFKNDIESEMGSLERFASIKPFANRGAEQALRLATVIGYFQGVEQIDADCMYRACLLARYSLSEWQRYTDADDISPLLRDAASATEWLHHPKRVEDWREFDANRWGKSGPQSLRKAMIRDQVLNLLVEHSVLLT